MSLNNDKAKEALEKWRQKVKSGEIEVVRLDPITKALQKPTPSNCIKAKCYDCVGRNADGNWRDEVRECRVKTCPLYPVRPYKS